MDLWNFIQGSSGPQKVIFLRKLGVPFTMSDDAENRMHVATRGFQCRLKQ